MTWTYLLDKSFVAQLNVYYKWRTDLTQAPSSAFSIELYSSDWDDLLEEANLAASHRGWKSFADAFLRDGPQKGSDNETQLVNDFLSKVEGLQTVLDGAKIVWSERQLRQNH